MSNILVRCEKSTQSILGESPVWNYQNNTLYFLDIKGGKLYELNKDTLISRNIPKNTGSLACTKRNQILLSTKNGLKFLNPQTGGLRNFFNNAKPLNFCRFNDGKCSTQGSFWVSSMDNCERKNIGKLYQFSNKFRPMIYDMKLGIGNGIGWSPDKTRMYITDSKKKRIYLFKFNRSNQNIYEKRILIDFHSYKGFPDGLAVDCEGSLWVAMWDGGCINRFSSKGKFISTIPLPVPRPTSLAFGGEYLNTLFITSARFKLQKQDLDKFPLSGNLFSIKVNNTGQKVELY